MKHSKRFLIKSMFVLLAGTLMVPIFASSTAVPLAANQTQGQRGERPIAPLKGEALRLLVSKLRARNKGFDRAMRDMERMGKKPLWEASAAIPLKSKKRNQVAMFRPAAYTAPQDTISDGNGGEMVFITFDGPDSTWDGTVYVQDSERQATYNAVIEDYDVNSDSGSWDVVDEVYYPPEGGDPYREEPCGGEYCLMTKTKPLPRQTRADSYIDASYTEAPVAFGGGWFRNWWNCTRTGCGQAVVGCASSPTFRRLFTCSAIGCTARAIACVF
jgi:hypothetical protein